MTGRDEEFLKLLQSTFRVEAAEHLHTISSCLLDLEKATGDELPRAIEKVFRAAHTLKGAARAADFKSVEMLCQSLEETFSSWKRGEVLITADALDVVHRAVNEIGSILAPSEAVPEPVERPAPRDEAPPRPAEKRHTSSDATVRVAVRTLEAQLLQAEEILGAKLAAMQRGEDVRELALQVESWRRSWSAMEEHVRELRQADPLLPAARRLLDSVDSALEDARAIERRTKAIAAAVEQDRIAVAKLADELLERSKKLLLLPFSTIFGPLPKVVRDLSREQGKEAELTIEGDDVAIDKRILEEIKDPIVHLLRNSVDHGIEDPATRASRGKPRRATISIAISQIDATHVQLLLADDGAGIDVEKVRQSAVARGVITEDEASRLSDADAQRLIFQSDVSTRSSVTELSGRGLGLAIVHEKTEALGGHMSVESRPGAGTTFRIVLPSQRATFRGIVIEVAGRVFIVPTTQVERVGRTRHDDVRTVEGRATITVDGIAISLVRLADALELADRGAEVAATGIPFLVLRNGDQRIAFAVDAVVCEQEVLVKQLPPPLARVRNVSGATVLGSGYVAPILNVSDLLKSARKVGSAIKVAPQQPQIRTRSILIAEDSITSRMLLKSILESAGYTVKTAVDGMEAFTLLKEQPFDLVVTDVDMPRLSGFDLTRRIRADRALTSLPVVLVTALESREDRERGADAGANAYIVKGSFDQSDLLDAVRRLI